VRTSIREAAERFAFLCAEFGFAGLEVVHLFTGQHFSSITDDRQVAAVAPK